MLDSLGVTRAALTDSIFGMLDRIDGFCAAAAAVFTLLSDDDDDLRDHDD